MKRNDPTRRRPHQVASQPSEMARNPTTHASKGKAQGPPLHRAHPHRREGQHVAGLPVCAVQFGWETRKSVYSVEYEKKCSGGFLFDSDRGQFRVQIPENGRVVTIAIQVSQVAWAFAGSDALNAILFLALNCPPMYEEELPPQPSQSSSRHTSPGQRQTSSPTTTNRRRLSAIDELHLAYSPYTSHSIRIVFYSRKSEDTLRRILADAHVHVSGFNYPIARLDIFSQPRRDDYQSWLRVEGFEMAFQLDSIARANLLDLEELLRLKPHLGKIKRTYGTSYTAAFIRHLSLQARTTDWYWLPDHVRGPMDPLMRLFVECKNSFYAPATIPYSDRELFSSYHVKVTPSRLILNGPLPERNNRVMRKYAGYTNNFVRVSFTDEDGLQYRVSPGADGWKFIHDRFGYILAPSNGLSVAEHIFGFLAYSQSGLKSHAVWFVRPFQMSKPSGTGDTVQITAASIIANLGIFDESVQYDPRLMYCTARYAARLAQAFTATDAAVEVDPGEISIEPDIMDEERRRSFTDGAGMMSEQLASEIWETLQKKNPRIRGMTRPDVIQIRFQGSKGTLCVNANLPGRRIVLRRSMIKFLTVPTMRMIEVAAVFNKPAPFYLNRPLIMLLEGLKLKGGYEILKTLQDGVIQETRESMQSFATAARLLDRHGLGAGYKLSSVCQGIAKLSVQDPRNSFLRDALEAANHHILRDLRFRAHIPVPDGYTLVGVADPYDYLPEGEVYVCLTTPGGGEANFLEGRIMIARSPVAHPGDVQVARAVGRPPRGTPFDRTPLKNALVFSTKGSRPLASCLSGGDLDGDTYILTTNDLLLPADHDLHGPADYQPAQRKVKTRPSTMQDVAEFVTEYIYSDNIALIASRWLEIADKSAQGIFDPACMSLAALHSTAVDYPKSGQPVRLDAIPKPSHTGRPDWSAPETGSSGPYYLSQSYIGRLYREVNLPALSSPDHESGCRPTSAPEGTSLSLQNVLEAHSGGFISNDRIEIAIHELVMSYLHSRTVELDDKRVEVIWALFQQYVPQLRAICVTFSLTPGRGAVITEKEVVAGTIVAPASNGRVRKERKERISQMREQASILVDDLAMQLRDPGRADSWERLKRAWVGFQLTTIRRDDFGCSSFRLIALHEIFDALRSIENIPSQHGLTV